jgi:signal transduction histidine kinase
LLNTNQPLQVTSGQVNVVNFSEPWFVIYGAYFSTMFFIAYAYLFIGTVRHKGRMKAQVQVVLAGIFATSFIALVTNIILPITGNAEYVWVGPTATIFYIIATSYAMVKHGLFDLRLALVLTFTYGLSLVALAAIYYTAAFGVSALLLQDQLSFSRNVVDVGLAILLAFLFQPIKRFFDRVTSRIFYQGNYNVNDFFTQLRGILSNTTDLHQLLRNSAAMVAHTIKAANITFLIYDKPHHVLEISAGKRSKGKIPYVDVRSLDESAQSKSGMPIVRSLLDEQDRHLQRLMLSHKVAVIQPLIRQEKIIGYMCMGEHIKNDYAGRDIRVVKSISDELVIGIENALSLQEVKDLNAHLEQRIDTATKELRTSNAQLHQLDEAKDEFISMASHQLRTPLTSIKGYISMLIDGDAGKISKEQQHLLQEVFISSERMVRLISDFLNVSRLQTGKFMIDKHPANLTKIVAQELESLEPNAASHKVTFEFNKPKNIPELQIDVNKIQQVIMNFCDNALYYSKENSKIIVKLMLVKGFVELTVKDSGIGVPDAEQEQLFGKFFRATNARKQRPDGTGVGLFLAKKVIDAHGGKIFFLSKEGKGSTFGFRLPVKKH